MSSLPVYGYCMLVAAALVALLAMSADFFVAYINTILIPCQHDSVWIGDRCVCDNTGGVFAGTYCDECQCENFGVCGIIQQNSKSRWGCRCPSHQKWVGTLCDKCYTIDKQNNSCRGDCVENHYGPKCNTVCLSQMRSTNARCQEVSAGGGECNACNGNGECNTRGECECSPGYFTPLSGEQCSITCSDAGIDCDSEGGVCQSIGGKLQCVCKENYFGKNCDQTCPGGELPCSGHGSCRMDLSENLICTCSPHFTGEDCSLPCPGDNSYPTACSGHGQCVEEGGLAVCECSGGWESNDCSCSPVYTCSGHGQCNPDGSCECLDESPLPGQTAPEIHFAGAACERCKEHWFGQSCQLRCEPEMEYAPSSITDGLNIGCNGHGSCSLIEESSAEHVTCLCASTDPDTFCATCMPDYYPDIRLDSMSIPACSVECNVQTCSYHGQCNPLYNGSNDLCNCTKWENNAGQILDTLDPDQFCSTCKENWYPSDMDAPNRCSEYCAEDGELQYDKIIYFPISSTELDYDLNGDLEAKKVCSVIQDENNNTRYAPDPDCRVCSGAGKCMADGSCKCSLGTTGEYCNIECNEDEDGTVCSGHGRCIRNELDMWFNPYTNKYRCECTPYDTYTSETRQRLLKRGFQVEPPPSPEYYGKHCEFHCPRYNQDICSERGECKTGVAVATSKVNVSGRIFPAGSAVFCSQDDDCLDISGSFCARLSTPWDSLMDTDTKSFFSNGPESPGYFTCATSDNCIDSIFSIEWDNFCVNMLNGWYPSELNTAECAYNSELPCREGIERFFMEKYDDEDTWCAAAEKELLPPRGQSGVCGDNSYANKDQFINENVPICHTYTLETTCNAQPECIYDQTIMYIRNIDKNCSNELPPCSGSCQDTGNNTCDTKTYCRAKTCSDIMFEHNIEKMCLELDEPCEKSETDWQDFCANAVGHVRKVTDELNSMETFYGCYMYRNRNFPQRIFEDVPGGIPINGVLRVFSEDVSILEFRQSFIDSRIQVPQTCSDLQFTDTFCDTHLRAITPSWYQNNAIATDWFYPWIVVCDEGTFGVVRTQDAAFKLIDKLGKNCKEHYRTLEERTGNTWQDQAEDTESILYAGKLWTKKCLNGMDQQLDNIDYSDWSSIPSECIIEPNILHQRWGQKKWSPADVQRRFKDSCENGLEAPWVPEAQPVLNLCDMDICGKGHVCSICDDCQSHVVLCSKQEEELPVECHKNNPCQKGATCFQTPDILMQSVYYCDVTAPLEVNVTINSTVFAGKYNNHGGLSIVNGWENIPKKGNFTVQYKNNIQQSSYKRAFESTTSNAEIPFTMPYTFETPDLAIHSLKECDSNINWHKICSENTLGTELNTKPPIGLNNLWNGDAVLLSENRLRFSSIETVNKLNYTSLEIQLVSGGGITTTCGNNVTYWDTDIYITQAFQHCLVQGTYGDVIVSKVILNGDETILSWKNALENEGTREFHYPNSSSVSGYADWSFDEHGIMAVERSRNSILPPNPYPRGARWTLNGETHLRISGWAKLPEINAQIADMRLMNGDLSSIIHLYNIGNIIWVNGKQTDCRLPVRKWWNWRIQADYLKEIHRVGEVNGQTATIFEQMWQLQVSIDNVPCDIDAFVNITSSSMELQHHKRIASSFHDMPQSHESGCRSACHGHKDCNQWSWTKHDGHCYLHSTRCHEDESCTHGTHLLRAFHSQKIKYFDISSASTGMKSYWTRIRAEPIIEIPAPCEEEDSSLIDVRWRDVFERVYEPFRPDATEICNGLASTWELMPGYDSFVCGNGKCNYNSKDMGACAFLIENNVPNITETECQDMKKLNWTSYCRYRESFEPISGLIPFFGGLDLGSISNGVVDLELDGLDVGMTMESLCQTSNDILDNATDICPFIQPNWFKNCFERTSEYENHCSMECLDYIEDMLSSNSTHDGICEKRKEFLNINTYSDGGPSGISPSCECNMENVIITDFCLIQNAYHDKDNINIPELYSSECSYSCMDTLKQSMNRTQWRNWCSDLSEGTIPGVCSKTTCDCDTEEYAGVSGAICELTCPTGISDGEELACSGRNGQCFAMNPEEMTSDLTNQKDSGEIRSEKFTGPDIPVWKKGPDPNMPGRCQCALGTGLACSIPCYQCNIGTYGQEMSSQYGICDSFNGICRAFPSFMRYNTKQKSENYISLTTTAFESAQGVSRWQFPDRFLYESDDKLVQAAVNYLLDPTFVKPDFEIPMLDIDMDIQKNINAVLRTWPTLCAPDYNITSASDTYDFKYLSNSKSVTNLGIYLKSGDKRVLKTTSVDAWGECQKIQMNENWYLCFESGGMNAFDSIEKSSLVASGSGPMIVFRDGEGPLAQEQMTFAKIDDTDFYAYGGKRKHENTEDFYNRLYKVTTERVAWDPTDIIFISWEEIKGRGTIPDSSAVSHIWLHRNNIFLLNLDAMYQLVLPSALNDGQWTRYDRGPDKSPKIMSGNEAGQIYVEYEDGNRWTFDANVENPWFPEAPDITNDVGEKIFGKQGLNVNCVVKATDTNITVGGKIVAEFDQSPQEISIYLEEWLNIDVDINPILTFMNTILWNTKTPSLGLEDLNLKQRLQIVEIVQRIYMHQARWSVTNMMPVKYRLGSLLDINILSHAVPDNTPSDQFLQLFKSLPASFFGQVPSTSPNQFIISIEGEIYSRKLVITANYLEEMDFYEQEIDLDTEIIIIEAIWNTKNLFLRLKEKFGNGYVEWTIDKPAKAWNMIIHLEEWQYSKDVKFKSNKAIGAGIFQLYTFGEMQPTRQMDYQTSQFLQYTASHCSLSADNDCPGTLPYIDLPCSGRGRCNIACQCTCEVAKSVLENKEDALTNIDPSLSPWRGEGCEKTCPGYDGYNLESICSNRGTCQSDGTCACPQGFTGDACQFECPKNKDKEVCSSHGGCGTKAFQLSSFVFQGDQYMDMLTAINRERYSDALSSFYESCPETNYVKQYGSFGHLISNEYPSFAVLERAFEKCTQINKELDLDMTQEIFRRYPTGRCVGIRLINQTQIRYVPAILKTPEQEFYTTQSMPIFKCDSSDCSISQHEDDDLTIFGLKYKLVAPTYEFDIQYVHGNSKGRARYVVNDIEVYFDIDWTTERINISIGSDIYGIDNIVERDGYYEWVKIIIEDGDLKITMYPFFVPEPNADEYVYISPRYDVKYETFVEYLDGYHFLVPSEDTGYNRKLLSRKDAENDCDLEPMCLGIIRWDVINEEYETLYSLYTDVVNLNGWTTYPMVGAISHDYLKKMSLVYQGRESIAEKCSVVSPGLSRYPKVTYTEDYNIPIQDVNISLAKDKETDTVIIGDGYWSKCWKKIESIHTKMACYLHAKNSEKVYGFAFSEDTNICLAYTGIQDNTKIKLDRYNSESRLSIFDPCEEDASWFT